MHKLNGGYILVQSVYNPFFFMRTLDPYRKNYIKRIASQEHCEFCAEEVIQNQECKTLRTEYWRVIVALYPYLDGNVMIIPRRHITDTSELTENEWQDFHSALEGAKKRLGEIFSATSFNIGLNLGEYSGRSISHIHWQLIPRARVRNTNALEIFSELQVISTSPQDLQKKIDSGIDTINGRSIA